MDRYDVLPSFMEEFTCSAVMGLHLKVSKARACRYVVPVFNTNESLRVDTLPEHKLRRYLVANERVVFCFNVSYLLYY